MAMRVIFRTESAVYAVDGKQYVAVAWATPSTSSEWSEHSDHGRNGLSARREVFGAREKYVEFTPDLLEKLQLEVLGQQTGGRFFLQQYELTGGQKAGQYADGAIAAVEHKTGKGRTLLIGSFPGWSYFLNHASGTRAFFAGLLPWAGRKPLMTTGERGVQARLHSWAGGDYLWVVNHGREARTIRITLDNARMAPIRSAADVWQTVLPAVKVNGLTVDVAVADRNVAVVNLQH